MKGEEKREEKPRFLDDGEEVGGDVGDPVFDLGDTKTGMKADLCEIAAASFVQREIDNRFEEKLRDERK